MPRFLDANTLIGYLIRDDEEKARACLALLQRAQRGEERLITSDVVIAEGLGARIPPLVRID